MNSTHNERLAKFLAFQLGLPYETVLQLIEEYELKN